jgi:hypothetical protein
MIQMLCQETQDSLESLKSLANAYFIVTCKNEAMGLACKPIQSPEGVLT